MYLEVPSFSMRRKRYQFGYLKEKMEKRVMDWNHKCFSKGGKEVFIKAVLQAIPKEDGKCRVGVIITSKKGRLIAYKRSEVEDVGFPPGSRTVRNSLGIKGYRSWIQPEADHFFGLS